MRRLLRGFGVLVLAIVVVLGVTALVARVSDGPIGAFVGGPLANGTRHAEGLADWSVYRGVDAIDMQLVDPARSRKVWILIDDDGRLYIPSGFVKSLPFWKHWPHEAAADGRAVVRIEGALYPVQLVRVNDPRLLESLGRQLSAKYDLPTASGPPDPEEFWLFRVDSRNES